MSVIFRDQSVDQNTTKLSTPKSKRYVCEFVYIHVTCKVLMSARRRRRRRTTIQKHDDARILVYFTRIAHAYAVLSYTTTEELMSILIPLLRSPFLQRRYRRRAFRSPVLFLLCYFLSHGFKHERSSAESYQYAHHLHTGGVI